MAPPEGEMSNGPAASGGNRFSTPAGRSYPAGRGWSKSASVFLLTGDIKRREGHEGAPPRMPPSYRNRLPAANVTRFPGLTPVPLYDVRAGDGPTRRSTPSDPLTLRIHGKRKRHARTEPHHGADGGGTQQVRQAGDAAEGGSGRDNRPGSARLRERSRRKRNMGGNRSRRGTAGERSIPASCFRDAA